MTELLRFLTSGKWQANTIIATVFVLAAIVSAIYLVALVQGREIYFWPPKIGAHQTSDMTSTGAESRECDRNMITISRPKSDTTVPLAFEVQGTWKEIPRNYSFWVFTTARSGPSLRYWPQEQVTLAKDNTWSGQVHGIGKPGEVRTFGVFLVGPDGDVLLRYWKEAGQTYVQEGEKYLPLTRLTSDITVCDEIQVKVQPGGS